MRTVDLFSGCGGLTLGFDQYRGSLQYQSVLAVDNDAAALRVFNQNIQAPFASIPTGRQADLTWFTHRSEALLYYLSHYALWLPDHNLSKALADLGYAQFLQNLRYVDENFAVQVSKLSKEPDYAELSSKVDQTTFTLAVVKEVLGKLGISSLKSPSPDARRLPWTQEYHLVGAGKKSAKPQAIIISATKELWENQLRRLTCAAEGVGRGQHVTVATKVRGLVELLLGPAGQKLKTIWTHWRSARDTIRAEFCLSAEKNLQNLYDDGRRVGLVLGGPPCKGWSRIGRAVIESLREQGVHAWASQDYGDERNALLHNYVLFLDALRPDVFLFENVAHFESSLRTPAGDINAAQELQRALNLLGAVNAQYEVASEILSTREHAIPQDRDRYIMIGVKQGYLPQGIRSNFFSKIKVYKTEVALKIALQGLDEPGVFKHGHQDSCDSSHMSKTYGISGNGLSSSEYAYLQWVQQLGHTNSNQPEETDAHIVRAPRDDDVEFFRYLAPGLRWMDYRFKNLKSLERLQRALSSVEAFQLKKSDKNLPSVKELRSIIDELDESFLLRLLLEGLDSRSDGTTHHLLGSGYLAKGSDRHGDWLERLSPDRPCKTIVAHIGKDTYGYIHPTQPRALSIREAARVQSFPDYFKFGGSGVVDAYTMIGNAVPPMLAHQFASCIASMDETFSLFPGSVAPTIVASLVQAAE